MRPVQLLALMILACALAPAGAAARVGVTRHAINVTLLHERTLRRQAPRAQADAQIVRDRAAQCRDTFAAAPARARPDLADLYFNAVSGALWRTDRDGYRAWVARLAPAARASAVWRGARARLRRDVAAADRVYGAAVEDPCAVVEAWRANGFDAAHPPDEVLEYRRLQRTPAGGRADTPALTRLLRAQGTRVARRALAAFARGADEPDAKVIRRRDALWALLT